MSRPRIVLASASVALFVLVVGVSLATGPSASRWWLAVFAVLAVAMAVPGVLSEPRDLIPALVFALAPLVALLAGGGATWRVATLATLLLVAAELNALSWACEGPGLRGSMLPRRLAEVAQLAVLGLAASWMAGAAARTSWLRGTGAVLAAGAAVAGLAYVVFRGTRGGYAPTPPAGAPPADTS